MASFNNNYGKFKEEPKTIVKFTTTGTIINAVGNYITDLGMKNLGTNISANARRKHTFLEEVK